MDSTQDACPFGCISIFIKSFCVHSTYKVAKDRSVKQLKHQNQYEYNADRKMWVIHMNLCVLITAAVTKRRELIGNII